MIERIELVKRHRNWARNGRLWLCVEELSEYFDIPRDAEQITLVLSDRKRPDSYHVKQSGFNRQFIAIEDTWFEKTYAPIMTKLATAYGGECYLGIELSSI